MKQSAGKWLGCVLLVLLLVLCCISGCSSGGETSSQISPPSSSGASSSEPTEQPFIPDGMVANHLTGMPVEKAYETARPVGIMINNVKQAQPLIGISNADVVYECVVEGGVTRLLALFKNPYSLEMIGSIRSARPHFVQLARGMDAIYVHAGGSKEALSLLSSGVVPHFNLQNHGEMCWRDEYRRYNLAYEHSLVTSGQRLKDGIASAQMRFETSDAYLNAQRFDFDSQVLGGEAVQQVHVTMSGYKSTDFVYDDTQQTYTVSQFEKPQMDANTNEQNTADNILVLYASYYTINSDGGQMFEMVGSGEGHYISHGKKIDIVWNKNDLGEPFAYQTTDGEDLVMIPGRIYTCIVPLTASVNFQ